MSDEVAEPDTDGLEARNVLDDVHRQYMQEIRATVTRGATGIEASYFCDQHLSLAHTPS